MKRNISDYLVALAVIACSVVLLGALTFALSGYQVKKPARTLAIHFNDVAGIKLHSEVRYAGAPAGRVIEMRPLTPEERAGNKSAVRLTVSINDEIPPLPADVKVSLGSDTLLSEKFVGLSAGTPGGKTLENGATIQAESGTSIDQLAQSIGPMIENANELLSTVRSQVNIVLPKIATLADSTDTTAKSVTELMKHMDKFIADTGGALHVRIEELHGVIKNLDEILVKGSDVIAKGGQVLDNANGFIGSTDKDLDARMKELRVVLENLKVVTTHAKAITETLGEKPSRLIWGSKPNKLVPEASILKSSEPLPAKAP